MEALGVLAFGSLTTLTCSDNSDMSREIVFTAKDVVRQITERANEDDAVEWATSQKVGLVFNTLRIPKDDRKDAKGTRNRKLRCREIHNMLHSYGILPGTCQNMSDMSDMSEDSEEAETSGDMSNGTHGPANGATDADGFDWETGEQKERWEDIG